MAFARKFLYSRKDQLTSQAALAIGHPARLRILFQLYKSPPKTVGELKKIHRLSYPSLSQHLSVLREYDLVHCKERCPYTYYWLHEANFLKAISFLQQYLDLFKKQRKARRKK